MHNSDSERRSSRIEWLPRRTPANTGAAENAAIL
jgi:hypothetical protein